jgi:hypothetical protein
VAGESISRPGGSRKPRAANTRRSVRAPASHLTAQNGHLMTESEDLKEALRVRAGRERGEVDRQPDQHINGRVGQEA